MISTSMNTTIFFALLFFPVQNVDYLPILKPNREKIPFKTILSIDGGGTRAAIPLAVLIELEEKIKTSMVENAELLISNGVFQESDLEILSQGTDKFSIQLADYFDLTAGVSAGSLVAAYIATRGGNSKENFGTTPGTSAENLKIFSEHAPNIFKPDILRRGLTVARYSSNGIDSSLQKIFGQDTLLSNIENITFFATSFELENSRTIFFFKDGIKGDDGIVVMEPPVTTAQNFEKILDIEQPNLKILDKTNFRVWETVRCSMACPTLLPAHIVRSVGGDYKGTCIDGGVIANNPDMHALTFLSSRQNVNISEIAILSLGSGTKVENLAEGRSVDRGSLNWASDLIKILLGGSRETQEVLMDTIFYQYLGVAAPQYLRIQFRSHYDDDADEGSLGAIDDVDAIQDLVKIGQHLVKLHDKYLDQFVARFLLGTEEQPPPIK